MLPLIPPTCKRVIEPFAGSAVFSLNATQPAIVADVNGDLIDIFQSLKGPESDVFREMVSSHFGPHGNQSDYYYERREFFNNPESKQYAMTRAAAFIYMNRHGFNGLVRYNQSGGFNVPFGRYANVNCPWDALCQFAEQSKRMTFHAAGFDDTFAKVKAGDFVYADPPYSPLTETSNFTGYHMGGFSATNHEALVRCALTSVRAHPRVTVVISNHDTPEVRALYRANGAKLKSVPVKRRISASVAGRGDVHELIATWQS